MARMPHFFRQRKKSKTLDEPEGINRETLEALELAEILESCGVRRVKKGVDN